MFPSRRDGTAIPSLRRAIQRGEYPPDESVSNALHRAVRRENRQALNAAFREYVDSLERRTRKRPWDMTPDSEPSATLRAMQARTLRELEVHYSSIAQELRCLIGEGGKYSIFEKCLEDPHRVRYDLWNILNHIESLRNTFDIGALVADNQAAGTIHQLREANSYLERQAKGHGHEVSELQDQAYRMQCEKKTLMDELEALREEVTMKHSADQSKSSKHKYVVKHHFGATYDHSNSRADVQGTYAHLAGANAAALRLFHSEYPNWTAFEDCGVASDFPLIDLGAQKRRSKKGCIALRSCDEDGTGNISVERLERPERRH